MQRRSPPASRSPSRPRWSRGSKQQGEVTRPTSVPSRSPATSTRARSSRSSVQTKGVRIVPEANRSNDNAPSHRVFVGRAEIGAAWSKRSNEGRDYLSLKLDDPSFNAPIFANLFDDEDGEGFTLIWSRSRKKNGIGGRVVYAIDDLKAWADRGTKMSTSTLERGPCCRRNATSPLRPRTPIGCGADASGNRQCAASSSPNATQLDLFRALPGDLAPRDLQDLMAYPFFSLPSRGASHRSTSASAASAFASKPCPSMAWQPSGMQTS